MTIFLHIFSPRFKPISKVFVILNSRGSWSSCLKRPICALAFSPSTRTVPHRFSHGPSAINSAWGECVSMNFKKAAFVPCFRLRKYVQRSSHGGQKRSWHLHVSHLAKNQGWAANDDFTNEKKKDKLEQQPKRTPNVHYRRKANQQADHEDRSFPFYDAGEEYCWRPWKTNGFFAT
jgi:hypothetical protein